MAAMIELAELVELIRHEVTQLAGLLNVPAGVTGLTAEVHVLPDAITIEVAWQWRAREMDCKLRVCYPLEELEYAREFGNFWGLICHKTAGEVTRAMRKSVEAIREP